MGDLHVQFEEGEGYSKQASTVDGLSEAFMSTAL